MKKCVKSILIFLLVTSIVAPVFSQDWLYTVRRGDSPQSIGQKYLINPYRIDNVLEYNQIDPKQNLLPGTVIKFPLDTLKFGPARVLVVAVQGDVWHFRGQQKLPLSTVSSIVLKDKIITTPGASTTLRFADQSELLLGESSELVFDVLSQWGRTGMVDSRMRLLKGSVEGRVETLQGPGAHFEVHTPSAVATVRGTEFRVRVDQDNTTVSYNEVSEGKVNVENNVAAELVPQGFGLVSEEGNKAGAPIELLPAPELVEEQTFYPSLPIKLAWQANPKAIEYRLELFEGNDINKQLSTQLISNTALQIENLTGGEYLLRLRAVDENGLEGLNKIHKFKLSAAPKAPSQLVTSKQKYVTDESVVYQWQAADHATEYLWQLAADSDFEKVIEQRQLAGEELSLSHSLTVGDYFWRLSSINEHGKGQYSETGQFTVQLPAIPAVAEIADSPEQQLINTSWTKVPFAKQYQWQLATDKNFSNIVKQGITEQTSLQLNDLPLDDYYFRVAVDSQLNKHRYSDRQSFEVYESGNGKNPYMLSSLLLLLLAL